MGNQSDYFNRIGYRGEYEIGDRVFGNYQGVPFVASVGNDRLISELVGPEVSVHLDLPLWIGDKSHRILLVKHKDIKRLKEF
jgi:hypothetical protein